MSKSNIWEVDDNIQKGCGCALMIVFALIIGVPLLIAIL